jgi:hypothetical protein
MVGILPKGEEQLSILVRVYPLGDNKPYLPKGLTLKGWDDLRRSNGTISACGNTFINMEARQQDDYFQCQFIADVGESFCLEVSLGEFSAIEAFCV